MIDWEKACACGRSYTRKQWLSLGRPPGGGTQEEKNGEWLELRNCADCGSTLAVHGMPSADRLNRNAADLYFALLALLDDGPEEQMRWRRERAAHVLRECRA